VETSIAGGLKDVRAISRIAYAFIGSKALFAALDLSLFDRLAVQPESLESLAEQTGVAANRLATLLAVLRSLGLVITTAEGRFVNAAATEKYLVRGSDTFFGDYYRLQIDKLIYPNLLGLSEGLLGRPKQSIRDMLADPTQAALFTDAQHQGSMGPAVLLSRSVDLSARRSLLDVAGGSGIFSIVLCRRYAQLDATIIDFPSVIDLAKKYVGEAGLSKRIALIAGDALETPWPANQDVILMSYLLSAVGGGDVQRLFELARTALTPGGLLLVHDFMLEADRAGPREAALFFLAYIPQRTDSVSFTASEIIEVARKVGFANVRSDDLIPGLTSIVVAESPPAS
jgi:ubiquinone/menaquinone biosynthesis C-methylase UbiE